MLRIFTLLTVSAFLVNSAVALNDDIQQLREIIETFDKDYKEGNMTKLTSDFKNALEEYGDGKGSLKSTVVQSFLKKMEDNGEQKAMEKLETEWKDYVTSLGKHYDTEENNLRMAIFEGNELMTEETNRKYKEGLITYTTALNEFADLTDEEFKLMHGLRIPNETYLHKNRRTRQTLGQIYRYDPNEQLPDSMDWRKSGYVSSVKNQGECGSCYAFAATAALEAYYKKTSGRLVDLSPQNIVDCTNNRGNFGCSGGYMNRAFEYAAYYGIAQERQYPYAATVQNCRWHKRIALVNDKGYAYIPQGDELALKSAVAKYGPVVVGISASKRAFRFYSSGVFSHRNCGHLDHAVLVVGYGTDNNYGDYWIVKNSWGTSWGEAGYIYMARNRGNMCHIASMASFPI
ncbi:Cathepsin L-like [Dirofilaria immitis]